MTERPVQIIQITDSHLLADNTAPMHGWRNWQALDAVLTHAHRTYPDIDAALLTGDLVHDESPCGYRRLAERVQTLEAPVVCALPGNHDAPQAMHQHMPGVITTGPVTLGGWRLHLLNSHVHDSDGGRIGIDALTCLGQNLASHAQTPTLVAVHHPPVAVGAAWLDAMRLADGDALLNRLAEHQQACAVTCGHVHQAFDQYHAGTRVLCTPAVTRQFQPRCATFSEDARRAPGYRVLRLFPDGRLTTSVQRVPRARAACG